MDDSDKLNHPTDWAGWDSDPPDPQIQNPEQLFRKTIAFTFSMNQLQSSIKTNVYQRFSRELAYKRTPRSEKPGRFKRGQNMRSEKATNRMAMKVEACDRVGLNEQRMRIQQSVVCSAASARDSACLKLEAVQAVS